MRVAHFDCFSGISGDMVLGALLDAGIDPAPIHTAFASLGVPIKLEFEPAKRSGMRCTKAHIRCEDQEDYRFLRDILPMLERADITPAARKLATTIFQLVAEAEARSHGMPLEKVHFHEVGALDSIGDIVGVAVGLDQLGVERITGTAVPTGTGTVKCAHGIMPVPAPAAAELLKGVPLARSVIKGELTTPTGAAIYKAVVAETVNGPAMTVSTIGVGCGTKDWIEQPNIFRILIGTAADQPRVDVNDTVVLLETNLDDISPEIIGYTIEKLTSLGALEVFTQPIQMKKQRPGVLLSVIAHPTDADKLAASLFAETRTFGIRERIVTRRKRSRWHHQVETPWGKVRIKQGDIGDNIVSVPEYEDCVELARQHNVPLWRVMQASVEAFQRASS